MDTLATAPALLGLGDLSLDRERLQLSGPRGAVTLTGRCYAVAHRLMRRPGVIVARSDLIGAMYPDADDEPESVDCILRQAIHRLRWTMKVIGTGQVHIRFEPGVGYVIERKR